MNGHGRKDGGKAALEIAQRKHNSGSKRAAGGKSSLGQETRGVTGTEGGPDEGAPFTRLSRASPGRKQSEETRSRTRAG
jgi:hypothetical protein